MAVLFILASVYVLTGSVCDGQLQFNDTDLNQTDYVSIIISPVDINIRKENHSLLVVCVGVGFPQPSISWTFHGAPLENDSGIIIYEEEMTLAGLLFTESILTVCGVNSMDSGLYECTVTNGMVNSSSNFTVTVGEPAQLVIRPNAYNEVYQQNTLVVVCVAYGGDEPPSIAWKFGDKLLTNDSLDLVNIFEEIVVHDGLEFVESVLQVCNIDMNDTGVYSCMANNSRGSDNSNFTLNVVQAEIPMIVVKPYIIEPVAVGDTIVLTCAASGDPLPSFQWYKGGVPLINESSSTIYTEEAESNNLTLSILALCGMAVNDSGTYSCQATNFVGNSSFEFEILVMEGRAEVNTHTEDFTTYTMTPITAECTGRGFPQPSITWTHNGSPIENSSRIPIYEKNVTKEEHGLTSVSSYLEISNVRLSDGGIYECIVANRIVNASANFTLTVREPPRIIIAPNTTIEAYNETTVMIVCVGYGRDELPHIIWKYGDGILTNDTPGVTIYEAQVTENDLTFIESVLTLCDVGSEDAGNYSCTVNNSIGTAESSFTLNVKPNPPAELLIVPVNKTIENSGSTVYFVCVGASEIEHPNILWRYNRTLLSSGPLVGISDTRVTYNDLMFTSSILELCGIDLGNAGDYSCTAGYSRHSNSSSFTLLITFKLNCSVDESGLIIINCQEVDGYIKQLYCIYDSGPMEPCELRAVIDYSRFDNQSGSHNFTVLAVSTTEQYDDYVHPFNVSVIECVNLTEPGRTTVVCSARVKINKLSCVLDMQSSVSDCRSSDDLNNIVLTASDHKARKGHVLTISDPDTLGTSNEASLTVQVDINEEQMVNCSTTVDCSASGTVMTARKCCLNSEDGLSYSIHGQQRCHACKVFGWLSDSFTGYEQSSKYTIWAGYSKGGDQAGVNISFNVVGKTGTANHTDFFTDVSAIEVMKGGNTSVTVTFIADGIPDEPDESFTLNLEPKPFTLQTIPRGEAVFFRSTITLTIMDSKAMPVNTASPALIGSTLGTLSLLLIALIAAVSICGIWYHRRRTTKQGELSLDQPLHGGSDYAMEELPFDQRSRSVDASFKVDLPPHLIIKSSNIKLTETVGQGEYGIVYKGFLVKNIREIVTELVAIKTLKGFYDPSAARNMLKECSKMYHFKHPNVLTLCGVCLDGGPAPYIIMPYMANGSLLAYLKKNKGTLIVSYKDNDDTGEVDMIRMRLIDMCIQVAKGMEYLASMKVVHRDLAARNCMMDMSYVIKVADFGLSENMETKEYYRQDQTDSIKLPLKWMAPESMEYGVFSEKSDIWSYGVTCWEIFSAGKVPYAGIVPMKLPKLVPQGHHLEKPVNDACNDDLFQFMLKCWELDPETRPTFSMLVKSLSKFLDIMAGYMDVSNIKGEDYSESIFSTSKEPIISNELKT